MILGYRIGKSSIGRIRFRIMVFFTICFLPFWWFCDQVLGYEHGLDYLSSLVFIWGCWQAGGFFTFVFLGRMFMYIYMNTFYGNALDYHRWLEAGGDPFYDYDKMWLNPDPLTVKMAIGVPPTVSFCTVCDVPLGQAFGNRCLSCGRIWDNY